MTRSRWPDRDSATAARLAGLIIALAGALTYANSVTGVFVLDDIPTIVGNPQFAPDPDRSAGEALRNLVLGLPNASNAGRPLISSTLWLNHLLAQKEPFGYHLFNIAVHLLAGVALFGFVRRTLHLVESLRPAATPIAFSSALIWTLHPLNSSAVSYISQRAESAMGLFFLLAFYCLTRGFQSRRHTARWYAAAVVSCCLSEMSKEVGAMIPLLAVLYDRAFLAGSWRAVLRQRWPLHLALFATWTITLLLLFTDPRPDSAGWSAEGRGISSWNYATAQCVAIMNYLRLVLWPQPLLLDYGWPIPTQFSQYATAGIALLSMLSVGIWAQFFRPRWGFVAAWFFIILGPSSSFMPIVTEIVAEHRMYLPSAAVIAAIVIAVHGVGLRVLRSGQWSRQAGLAAAGTALLVTAGALCRTAVAQNALYYSGIRLWEENVRHTPANPRAWINLGAEYEKSGRLDEALASYRAAARHSRAHAIPVYPMLEAATDDALRMAFRLEDADAVREQLATLSEALERLDDNFYFYVQIAKTLERVGRPQDAVDVYRQAIRASDEPRARLHFQVLLAETLMAQRRFGEALESYREALLLEPQLADSGNALPTIAMGMAMSLVAQDRSDEARRVVAQAIAQPPGSPVVDQELERIARMLDAPEDAPGP